MSCLNLQGYEKGCDNSVGGIKSVVIFEFDSATDFVIDATGELTELTLDAANNAYKYEFLKDNSNFTDAIVGDGISANASFVPTLNMIFRKNSLSLVQEVFELSKNFLVAIVEDNNGEYWTLGLERGLSIGASAGASSGAALTDPNNYTILLTGAEARPMLNTDISSGSSIDAKILAAFGIV